MELPKIIRDNLKPIHWPREDEWAEVDELDPSSGTDVCQVKDFRVPLFDRPNYNWCWAAVAAGVSAKYHAPIAQCDIAGRVLHKQCCPANVGNGCNTEQLLEEALAKIGHPPRVIGVLRFEDIVREIKEDRPIGIRIVWSNGKAHFVAISAYSKRNGEQKLDIHDPLYGFQPAKPFDIVKHKYLMDGYWDQTYLIPG
jgi:hypothetical protein